MTLADYIVAGLALFGAAGTVALSIEHQRRKLVEHALEVTREVLTAIGETHNLINGPRMNGHGPVESVTTPYRPADTDPFHRVS